MKRKTEPITERPSEAPSLPPVPAFDGDVTPEQYREIMGPESFGVAEDFRGPVRGHAWSAVVPVKLRAPKVPALEQIETALNELAEQRRGFLAESAVATDNRDFVKAAELRRQASDLDAPLTDLALELMWAENLQEQAEIEMCVPHIRALRSIAAATAAQILELEERRVSINRAVHEYSSALDARRRRIERRARDIEQTLDPSTTLRDLVEDSVARSMPAEAKRPEPRIVQMRQKGPQYVGPSVKRPEIIHGLAATGTEVR